MSQVQRPLHSLEEEQRQNITVKLPIASYGEATTQIIGLHSKKYTHYLPAQFVGCGVERNLAMAQPTKNIENTVNNMYYINWEFSFQVEIL